MILNNYNTVFCCFGFCFVRNRVGSIDCINSQEFDEFKPIILNHFQKLNLKNDQQAIQIVHQKKTILELKNLMAKYDNTSTDLSPEDSTIFNATSPVKPSKVICKRLFDIKTIYKPGVTGPAHPKKKTTTTCQSGQPLYPLTSQNHC